MTSEHIVKAYDDELNDLKKVIIEMGGLVEAQLNSALEILTRDDPVLAKEIIKRDKKLDALEAEADAQAIRMLALRQPVAGDLRIIITALKISSNLERMGDYTKNVARRLITLTHTPVLGDPRKSLIAMSRMVIPMVRDVIDAFVEEDGAKALSIFECDKDVDRVYTALFRELLTYMMEDNKNISACTHLLFMAKNIERIGDHATNIGEQIYFMMEGHFPEDDRSKKDKTSKILVEED